MVRSGRCLGGQIRTTHMAGNGLRVGKATRSQPGLRVALIELAAEAQRLRAVAWKLAVQPAEQPQRARPRAAGPPEVIPQEMHRALRRLRALGLQLVLPKSAEALHLRS